MDADWIPIEPKWPIEGSLDRAFASFGCELSEAVFQEADDDTMESCRLSWLARASDQGGASGQALRFVISLLIDLALQGWLFQMQAGKLFAHPPLLEGDFLKERQRQRRQLLVAQRTHLSEATIQCFVKSMERRRLGPKGWCSVQSLIRDGSELSSKLKEVKPHSTAELRTVLDPYLQVVTPEARCELTGYKLSDIWRYFRCSWLNPSRSVPGRNIMFLVRDRSVPWHPVIGIAAIASSIVQQSARDHWIGWTGDQVLAELTKNPNDMAAIWLSDSWQAIISDIYVNDFIAEGLISAEQIDYPTKDLILTLQRTGEEARGAHRQASRKREYKQSQATDDWSKLVLTPLYRSKRAFALADMLKIRHGMVEAGFTEPTVEKLTEALKTRSFRDAVTRLVRYCKARNVGVKMMDITVAGAIPPYNHLLAGKLVSMLLTSPDVRNIYRDKYDKAASVIASAMKGEAVARNPDLVLLCTTGLFGGHCTQYNRISVPSKAQPGKSVKFKRLASSTSYATFQFSQATMTELTLFAHQFNDGLNVNGIFGEGVNPRMRKLREEIHRLGLPADALLRAASPRSVFGIALAGNFREVLLGKDEEPVWILEADKRSGSGTSSIIDHWMERWVLPRTERSEVFEKVASHTTEPISSYQGFSRSSSNDNNLPFEDVETGESFKILEFVYEL